MQHAVKGLLGRLESADRHAFVQLALKFGRFTFRLVVIRMKAAETAALLEAFLRFPETPDQGLRFLILFKLTLPI